MTVPWTRRSAQSPAAGRPGGPAMDRVIEIAQELDLRDERDRPATARRCLLRGGDRPRARRSPSTSSRRCASPACSTTSGRSASPDRSSRSPGRSRTTSGPRCRAIRGSAPRSSRTPGWRTSGSGSSPTTSGPTAAATPAGLSDADIPLEAKILAVADAYEAMTNDRCYRRSIGRERAVAELRRHAGQPVRRGRGRRVRPRARAQRLGATSAASAASPVGDEPPVRWRVTRWS